MNPTSNNDFTLHLPDGTALKNFKRPKGGSTKKGPKPFLEGRPIENVAIPLRHSQAKGRDEGPYAKDTFFAAQTDLEDCVRRCQREGWNIVAGYLYLNYTGAELEERLEHLLVEMEEGVLDAIVVPELSRFARTEEAHRVIARIKMCGGHLISARETFDIYEPSHAGIIGFLIGKAAGDRETARKTYEAVGRWKVDQGCTTHGHYGYEWVEEAHDIANDDGTVTHFPRGSLKLIDEEARFGREIYLRLAARQTPKKVAAWLNDNKQRTRGRRRADGTRMPGHGWSPTTVKRWARSALNRGAVKRTSYVNEDAHEPMVPRGLWQEVFDLLEPGSVTSTSSRTDEVRLLTGALRCAGCRSALTIDGSAGSWRCTSGAIVDCPMQASVRWHIIEEFIEARFLEAVGALQNAVAAASVTAGDENRLAELQTQLRDADESIAKQYADLETKDAHRARYDAACTEAERRAGPIRQEYKALAAKLKRAKTQTTLLARWPLMTIEEKNESIRGAWPIIWVRKGEHFDEDGALRRRRDISDRVWPISADEAHEWDVPYNAWVEGNARRTPVAWWDGSVSASKQETARWQALKAHWTPEDDAALVRVAASEEVLGRWRAARTQFKAHGRTDDEVHSAVARWGRSRAAARELGMAHSTLQGRLIRMARAGGLVQDSILLRAAQVEYQERGRTDDEIRAALVVSGGNYAQAARELGMPHGSLWVRAKKLAG